MTPEDEEFNRIEREAKQRMESVSAALDKMADNERDLGIQMRTEYERGFIDGMQKQMQSSVDKAVNRMANQPAQQEPVGWFNEERGILCKDFEALGYGFEPACWEPLYTSPQPAQQEPVAWLVDNGGDAVLIRHSENFPGVFAGSEFNKRPLVYGDTFPPQRTWVGLTLEDMETTHWSPDFRAGAKWAAAKLSEKNT